jgi:hypothetical protein
MYKHIVNESDDDNEEIEEDDFYDDECDIGDMDVNCEVFEAENTFFNPSVETETKKKTKTESETEELKCELCVFKTKD